MKGTHTSAIIAVISTYDESCMCRMLTVQGSGPPAAARSPARDYYDYCLVCYYIITVMFMFMIIICSSSSSSSSNYWCY